MRSGRVDRLLSMDQLILFTCLKVCPLIFNRPITFFVRSAGSLPISTSVNSKGVSSSTRNVSLTNYTVGDSIPLECVVEGCRSFDQLTIEWVDPEGTVIDEYSGEFTQGQQVFSHNLPVSEATQSGSYHCRVRTSLRQVSYAVTASISLQGVCKERAVCACMHVDGWRRCNKLNNLHLVMQMCVSFPL